MAVLNVDSETAFRLGDIALNGFLNDQAPAADNSNLIFHLGNGETLDFIGTFKFTSDGQIEDGSTITALQESAKDGTSLFSLSGLSLEGSTFFQDGADGVLGQLFAAADTLNGSALNDVLRGLNGADTLYGGAGDDTLDGGAGADSMIGGVGNDTYYVNDPGDVIVEQAKGGHDIVQSSVDYTLSGHVEDLVLIGTDDLSGSGNGSGNRITGSVGQDILNGYGGDDTLDGGVGADLMIGGSGNDLYLVNDISDSIVEAAHGGHDRVEASVSYTLSAEVEDLTLTGTAKIDGTGNASANVITGNAAANHLSGLAGDDHLVGGDGNDTLDGGSGADTMTGGAGDDTYVIDNKKDVVTEAANGGHDQVRASISYSLSANVEDLTLTGSGKINGTGNTLANTITGNGHANVLKGADGNDHLSGGGGDDTLVGGHGADKLTGGSGADTFLFVDGDLGTSKSKADVITDFSHKAGDLIDLSQVDAIKGGDHDPFTFINDNAFDGKAGELRVMYSGGDTYLVADTNGDKTGDLIIKLDGQVLLHASDFTAASLFHG